MATITLEVPDELAARLRERAEEGAPPIPEFLTMLKNRSPEELEADRAEMLLRSPLPRPLPPGKTFAEAVREAWPSGDTDREIEDALRLVE